MTNGMLAEKTSTFELLYEEHFVKVYRLALTLTRNPSDAEEITQEAFLKAFRSYDSFRADSSFFTWIYRITLNAANDYMKQRDKMMTEQLEDEGYSVEEIPDDDLTHDPETEALAKEAKVMCLHSITECLSGRQRKVFCLVITLGLTQKTAAEILGCSVGAVKVALHRAKKQWFGYMEGRCELVNKNNPCHCKQWVKLALSRGWLSSDEAERIDMSPNPERIKEVLDMRSLCDLYRSLYPESDTDRIAERIKTGIQNSEWGILS
jgi:RNA polymerase sigma-70 factor (ECF subfamily)